MNATAIGIVAAAIGAGVLGWMGRGLVADHMEIPRVIEQQAELCAAVTEQVAATAVAAEQLRQFHISERATQKFIDDSLAAADDARARQDLLELEIDHYAQRIGQGGSVCALDDAALELIGVRQAAEPDRPGGR